MAYGDDGGFAAWLAANGYVLPETAPSPAILRLRGSEYVDAAYEAQLMCSHRAGGYDQERAWPRVGHVVAGQPIPSDTVPRQWIMASYRAAWLEATNPGWATGTINPNRMTKREKAGEVEREFFGPSDTGTGTDGALGNVDAAIQGMVAPFFCVDAKGEFAGVWAVGS